jgi:diketogulonate reductase-like aldo/keto reductase
MEKQMTTKNSIALNNGVELPQIGLGVFLTPPEETRDAVQAALSTGYRHIDTAAAYFNEKQVGEAVSSSGIARDEIFVETKIWISDYGYDETLYGFEKSAAKLGLDQIDLLILHQPLPTDFDRTVEAYRALQTLLEQGNVRAIGVSNFMVDHLTKLLQTAKVVPAVNQIEVHPYFQQHEVQAFGAEHGILTQAWSPIGGVTFRAEGDQKTITLENPTIVGIAEAHSKSPAQVMLRWHIQQGRSVIPKSTKAHRIAENFDVFDFELSADDMAANRRARYRQARRPRARLHHPRELRHADPRGRRTHRLRMTERARQLGPNLGPTLATSDPLDAVGRTPSHARCRAPVRPRRSGGQGVASSNLASPTKRSTPSDLVGPAFNRHSYRPR